MHDLVNDYAYNQIVLKELVFIPSPKFRSVKPGQYLDEDHLRTQSTVSDLQTGICFGLKK